MERKRFTHGTGRLDAQQLNLMAEAAWQAENTPDPMNMPALRGPFMGIINPPSGTAPQVLENDNNGNPIQWGYAVAFVSPEWATAPDGGVLKDANSGAYRSTGFSVEDAVALNMVEMNNSSLNIMNVQTSNLPAGFTLQPVPTSTHALVWLAPMEFDATDTTTPGMQGFVAYFSYTNQFDGDC